MKRKLYTELLKWKADANHKPLIINGARQVGKSYIIAKFGENEYENCVLVDLESNKSVRDVFDGDLIPQKLVEQIEVHTKQPIKPHKTLLVLDEIQSCPRALTSLKYFQENAPEYDIIVAGSLLGVAVNRESYSFPVGKVDELQMFPMDFEEFLWSQGHESLANAIREHCLASEKMPNALHSLAIELYKKYLVIGGMPAAVAAYNQSGSLLTVASVQQKILNDYTADMSKYADKSTAVKVSACYDSMPMQLAKENKKFQYKIVQKGATSTLFGESIDWLLKSGLVLRCQLVTPPSLPLAAYVDASDFKLYMSDTGLLVRKTELSVALILSDIEADNTFLGAVTENYVAQALTCLGKRLYYWKNKSGMAEVDFLMSGDTSVVPVEVKKSVNVRSKSLNQFIQTYHPVQSLRISLKNFGSADGIVSIPLYAIFCL